MGRDRFGSAAPVECRTSLIGSTLSHYEITAKLGKGGMGEVWRARDTKLGREVALKVLPPDLAADRELLDRFQREAKVLAKLDHANIVTVHSIEEDGGRHFLTMGLIEGRSLDAWIPEGGLPLDDFFEIALPIADALAAAHDCGVIHRDVKPSNVMVCDDGRVKVLDFGLAKLCAEDPSCDETQLATEMLTQDGRILGTVAYMSPEQAQGKTLDGGSDIFSLGVVLYQMATGKHPFAGDNQVATLSSIVKDTPSMVTEVKPELPRHLGRIIRHALEKEPEKRFQSAKDLYNELLDLRRELGSGEAMPASAEAGGSLLKRWALIVGIALASLVLAGVVLDLGPFRDELAPGEGTALAPVSEERSIAVLPFENLSPDPDNAYFSLGMTEELVSKLSRIQSVRVRSTPLEWAGEGQRTVEEIGRELGVDYLLEGSVRRADEAVRITARLIDPASGFHLWSEDFDGELEDVFGMQEATALRIAEALEIELSVEEGEALADQLTESVEAYDAYLRGWALIESFHIHRDRVEERLDAAQQHFQQSLELDAEYPRALAGLAMVESYTYYLGVDEDAAHIDRGEELAERALALEPDLPEALVALGQFGWLRLDYEASEKWLRRAARVDSDNGYIWCELAAACMMQDPPDAELGEMAARKAIRYQPGYTWSHAQLGQALKSQGRYEEAVTAFRHAVELDREFSFALEQLGASYLALGEHQDALESYEAAFELLESSELQVEIAIVHAARGDSTAAFEALSSAIASGYEDIDRLTSDRHLETLREDDRFDALLKSVSSSD